jgi:hypothetical protein
MSMLRLPHLRAHEPLAPIRHGRLGAVSLSHLGLFGTGDQL